MECDKYGNYSDLASLAARNTPANSRRMGVENPLKCREVITDRWHSWWLEVAKAKRDLQVELISV